MNKYPLIGGSILAVVLLVMGSSMPVFAQNQDKMATPSNDEYSIALIWGHCDGGQKDGMFHIRIDNDGLIGESPLFILGLDNVTNRLKFEARGSVAVFGGLHIGILTYHWCCVLARNVWVF